MGKRWTLRTAGMVLVVMTLLGIVLPVVARDQVPFRGHATAAITAVEPVSDGLYLTVVGKGRATHLGKFTRVEKVVLHPDFTLEGTLELTAAKGVRLCGNVVGGFISPTVAVGTCSFTGGTGRFRKASGGYEWVGVSIDGVHFDLAFGGNLSY